ncbi:MAG: CHAT domain-containing protein [Bryobacteraceae bacterium]|jgi:hypothetical protein
MRTIRLEILRHGPSHNQLLSPLTEYFALCENHPAVTVRLPFEHAEFLARLRALQYKRNDPEYRALELEDVSRQMTEILGQVPGLIRELAGQAADADQQFHLRLILSANELALLPFEITNAAQGFAGAGQPLLLQSQSPVCITREVRRVATEHLEWPPPPDPRILFAAAGPDAQIPLEEHLLVLRAAIDPWVFHYKDEKDRRAKIGEHLTVLPRATLREIETECATGKYTHVHILAHGVPLAKGDDRRFGIALYDSADPERSEIVEGTRLAKAIRAPLSSGDPGLAHPAVVTLAACNAGDVGSVVGAGASIAHALHEEGIPLVVASQFPLSFPGSVVMAQVLYEGLLVGEDPRTLLVNLRRKLRTQVAAAHDWVSIVAYASLPADLDQKLGAIQIYQAFRRLGAAINYADKMIVDDKPAPAEMAAQRDRLMAARNRIDRLIDKSQDAKNRGILASADKRLAQILFRMTPSADAAAKPKYDDVRDRLKTARKNYDETFRRDRSQVWALVQAMALTLVLRGWDKNEKVSPDQWTLARIFSDQEVKLGDRQRQAWAHANLMELYLLALAFRDSAPPVSPEDARVKATEHAQAFRNVADLTAVEIHSTRRQVLRYSSFFAELNEEFKSAGDLAAVLANEIPESSVYA